MKIKNFETLAKTPLRRAVLSISEAGLEAVDTETAVKNGVKFQGDNLFVQNRRFALSGINRIFFVGVGKCASEAARVFEEILGDKLNGGVLIDVAAEPTLKKIRAYAGTHPLPSEINVRAAKEIVNLLKGLEENDFVIFVVSGGGSALLCLPEDMVCEDEVKITDTLIKAGATIQEINTIRKHLSLARGGYLAKYAFPAKGVALVFSDVPGDDIQFIASGPTVKDETTVKDAGKILAKYDVLNICGLENCGLVETPKEDKYFRAIENMIFVSNKIALEAMAKKAAELGYQAEICTTCLTGDTQETARQIAEKLSGSPSKKVFLYGGETTVRIIGEGKGGRNMQFALSALPFLKDGQIVAAFASDGVDNSDFAGAICDRITMDRAVELSFEPQKFLADDDAYSFFQKVGDYILTGPTGSNVSDLVIAING